MLQEAITSIAVRTLKTEEGDVLGLMSEKVKLNRKCIAKFHRP